MSSVLALTTKVAEPKKFTLDDEEYEMLGMDHLTKSDEAHAVALFSRYMILVQELNVTDNVQKGRAIAESIADCRVAIICKLTTLPKEIAVKLPTPQQALLLEALQAEVEEADASAGEDVLKDIGPRKRGRKAQAPEASTEDETGA